MDVFNGQFMSVPVKRVTNDINDGSVPFGCFSKPWQWARMDNTGGIEQHHPTGTKPLILGLFLQWDVKTSAVKNAFYFGEYNVIKTDKNDNGQATENWIQAVINGNYPLTYLLTVLDLTCIILTTNLTLSLIRSRTNFISQHSKGRFA